MRVEKINCRLGGRNDKSSQVEETDAETTRRKEEKVMRSVCSMQSRVGPPEYRKWRRVHGLQLPLHPQQVAGWVILVAVGVTTFLVLLPALRPLFRDGLFIILGSLFGLHVLSHLAALLLDPADPELRALKVKFSVPEFDRTKHAHVIENGRCHLCNIKTSSSKTKHCSVCNKCVDHFDHHCKWLNHCIGGRNYIAFLICVVSAVVASLVIVGVSVLEVVYYHVDPDSLTVFSGHRNETDGSKLLLFLPDSVFLGTITVLGLLSATTAGLLLHLCLFHCYISMLGISTYEYIRNYRQETVGNAQGRLTFFGCSRDKREIMSNQLDNSEKGRSKSGTRFENCCYYSCSRPPETADVLDDDRCCSRDNVCRRRWTCFSRGDGSGEVRRGKPLKRQNTDPEFVDRVIKPFLINLNDEANADGSTSTHSKSLCSTLYSANERKRLKCDCKDDADRGDWKRKSESSGDLSQEQGEKTPGAKREKGTKLTYKNLHKWCPNVTRDSSLETPAENGIRIKNNQVRPASAGDVSSAISRLEGLDKCPGGIDVQTLVTVRARMLPELNESVRKIRGVADLKEISSVLDQVDRPEPEFALQATTKSYRRKMRRKASLIRPRSPYLSPIRESGLSNPGSPRVDLVLPPSPVYVRSSTPVTSVIFLSNPNTPPSSTTSSTSDVNNDTDDDDDDRQVVTHTNPMINRHYKSDEILQTPQLPRKVYPGTRTEHVFEVKPSKTRSSKWIDVQIKNEV